MKILVRLPNWLGDVVMSTAFTGALHQHYPNAEIHVIVKKEIRDIAGLIPNLHTVHAFSKKEFGGLTGVYRFGKSLRKEKYDLFFSLTNSISSAIMGWATAAPKRVGYRNEGRSVFLTHAYTKPVGLHRVDEYVTLLQKYTGKFFSGKAVKLHAHPANGVENLLLINFNSEAVSRRMPVEKGQRIINALLNNFPEITLGFIGAPSDTAYVNQLLNGLENRPGIINYTGKTGLKQLAGLMAASKVVLSTDSGPAHVANSVGIPLVVLFGAGNENKTSPYNVQHLHVLRLGQLICEPCVKNTCIFGLPKCLQLLDEQLIVNRIKPYLTHA